MGIQRNPLVEVLRQRVEILIDPPTHQSCRMIPVLPKHIREESILGKHLVVVLVFRLSPGNVLRIATRQQGGYGDPRGRELADGVLEQHAVLRKTVQMRCRLSLVPVGVDMVGPK